MLKTRFQTEKGLSLAYVTSIFPPNHGCGVSYFSQSAAPVYKEDIGLQATLLD